MVKIENKITGINEQLTNACDYNCNVHKATKTIKKTFLHEGIKHSKFLIDFKLKLAHSLSPIMFLSHYGSLRRSERGGGRKRETGYYKF
jgi:hypothetical protein